MTRNDKRKKRTNNNNSKETSGSSGPGGGGPGGGGPGNPGGGESCNENSQYCGEDSLKGIKASVPDTVTDYENKNKEVVYIKISGGRININSRDDGIHCGGNIEVKGGEITIETDDDGIHSDYTLLIINGTINVTNSYEGLEAQFLTVNGGVTAVYGRDDGWNAAGGSDGSGNSGGGGWGGWGGGGPGGSTTGTLEITGGFHYIKTGKGDVDGIDSNGPLTISNSAVVVVECQISGGVGGSYDADGTTTLTSPTILGFSSQNSERAQNYSVNFNTNGYYGTSNIAFKPTISGSKIQSIQGQQISQINDVSGYNVQQFPNGLEVYYK